MALYYTRLTRAVERKINTHATRDVPFNPPFRLSMGILFSTRLLQILERKFPLPPIEDTLLNLCRVGRKLGENFDFPEINEHTLPDYLQSIRANELCYICTPWL